MAKIKPYSEGWEKLSIDERIANWLSANGRVIGRRRIGVFYNFLKNFSISYKRVNANTLEQLDFDLRETKPEPEFWTEEEKLLARAGVFAIYNTTPALAGLTNFNDARDGHKYN